MVGEGGKSLYNICVQSRRGLHQKPGKNRMERLLSILRAAQIDVEEDGRCPALARLWILASMLLPEEVSAPDTPTIWRMSNGVNSR